MSEVRLLVDPLPLAKAVQEMATWFGAKTCTRGKWFYVGVGPNGDLLYDVARDKPYAADSTMNVETLLIAVRVCRSRGWSEKKRCYREKIGRVYGLLWRLCDDELTELLRANGLKLADKDSYFGAKILQI